MAIDTHGLEAIRRSADLVSPENQYDALIKVRNLNDALGTIQYNHVAMVISPATTETYTFKSGGLGGTTVATVTIVYQSADRNDISTVDFTVV